MQLVNISGLIQKMNSKKTVVFLILALNVIAYSQNTPYYISYPKFENKHWMIKGDDDSISGNWSYLQPLPKPLIGVNSYYRADSNKIFICGGLDSNQITQASCYSYNLSTNAYEPRAPLPEGRWSGKLVRVRDSLYLVGSIDSDFTQPDGKIFRYSLNTNSWQLKSIMPAPYVIESAVCQYKDSLIISVGGSTDRFEGATSIIRVYNPFSDSWKTLGSNYPVPVTTAHAECLTSDTASYIVVLGGYGNVVNDLVCKGQITMFPADSTHGDTTIITWVSTRNTVFDGGGIYRVSGGRLGEHLLFGPGLQNSTTVGEIFALTFSDTNWNWTRILPNVIDSTSDIPEIAVSPGTDTAHFYLFGGFSNPAFSSQVKTLSYSGSPIGINPIAHSIPKAFRLYQNYPNPFNPSTIIKYDVNSSNSLRQVFLKLAIYDILGREVAVLYNGYKKPGSYQIDFDASKLASGVYFYMLTSGDFRDTKKMLLIK